LAQSSKTVVFVCLDDLTRQSLLTAEVEEQLPAPSPTPTGLDPAVGGGDAVHSAVGGSFSALWISRRSVKSSGRFPASTASTSNGGDGPPSARSREASGTIRIVAALAFPPPHPLPRGS